MFGQFLGRMGAGSDPDRLQGRPLNVLDPFAGSGTAVLAAESRGARVTEVIRRAEQNWLSRFQPTPALSPALEIVRL
jgi:hypothetical protein